MILIKWLFEIPPDKSGQAIVLYSVGMTSCIFQL